MPNGALATIGHVQQAVSQLLTSREPQFIRFGWMILSGIMFWRFFRLGMKWLYTKEDHALELTDLILLLSVNGMLLTFYDAPLPGTGISASNMVTDTTGFLANLLDARSLANTFTSLDILWGKFVQPGVLDVLMNLMYWALFLGLLFTKAVALGVVAMSLIFSAVAALLGPLFVPWLSMPGHGNKLFWGWFWAFLEYSFLQVTMFAYLFVGEKFITRFVMGLPNVIIDSQFPLYIAEVATVIGTYVIGVLLVPVLNHSLFSGHGGGTGPGIFAGMVKR